MSSSELSYNADQDSFGFEDYEIEYETCETTSKDKYEGNVSYAVEDEFLDNTDELIDYTDEPLADDLWVEEYLQRQEDYTLEIEELNLRLNEETPLISWCKCGNCNTQNLVEAKECRCCTEIQKCVYEMNLVSKPADEDDTSRSMCIINHPGFDAICLKRWSLELASDHFKTRGWQKYRQIDSKERFLRVVAYRQFTKLVHGHLKEKRIPLPACAYHAIRAAFNEKDDNFRGYEDLDEN